MKKARQAGHAESAGKPLDPAIIAQLRMPAKFQALEGNWDSDNTGYLLFVVPDQQAALEHDVHVLRSHPLIGDRAQVAGFIYDVDSGLLTPAG